MKINLTEIFQFELNEIVIYIAKDKPISARKFKNDLIQNIQKDLINPFQFKKSIYFEDELYRDYVFKGYTVIIKVDVKKENVYLMGILKHQVTSRKTTWKSFD